MLFLKSKEMKKRGGKGFDDFTFIEKLPEPEQNLCDLCGFVCKVIYRVETDNRKVFLCEECWEKIKNELGLFEWRRHP